jgi:3,4-dihydroxy 2-butanone 4-phosphate synthase/GTP cyclohydrolase II
VKRLRSKAGQGTARSARSAHGKVRSVHGAARIATPRPANGYATVEEAIADIAAGRFVIVVDDEDRENEGDLTMAAEKVTPEAINFMARFGRGLICMPMTEERLRHLDIPLMVQKNTSPYGTAFCVSIEARDQVSTGISAADRARTVLAAIHPKTRPSDLTRPGHMFPLRAKNGGVLVRTGQTEGSVDLAKLAGLEPAGVICEIMNDDGTMARMPDLEKFAAEHGLMILTIADLIEYRLRQESLVERAVSATIAPVLSGLSSDFRAYGYRTPVERTEYLALVLGDVTAGEVLVRVQTACIPGDVFGSAACDCGAQLRAALTQIEGEGRGVFLYVLPGGRMSLIADVESHVLHQDVARAGGESKLRDFGLGAQVLADLGLSKIRLMTNNPRKIVGLDGYGICVVDRVPLEMAPMRQNITYLRDKRDREGHLLAVDAKTGKE